MSLNRTVNILVFLCLLAFFTICSIFAATRESLTFDEIVNLQEGMNNLTKREFLIEPYNPPLIRELAAIPIVLGFSGPAVASPPNVSYLASRSAIVLLAILLLILVFFMTKRAFGWAAGIFTIVFLAFDPTFLAHSHYITPDIGVTFFAFLAYSVFLLLLEKKSIRFFLLFGAAFGLAIAAKTSAWVVLVPSISVLLFLRRKQLPDVRHYVPALLGSVLVAAVIVWATYGFRLGPILVPHDNPARVSNRVILLARTYHLPMVEVGIRSLMNTPVPLGDYIGILKNTVIRGVTPHQDFFLGHTVAKSPWFALPLTYILKTPEVLLLVLLIGALGGMMMSRYKKKQTLTTDSEQFQRLITIPLVCSFVLLIMSGTGPLIRYLLPIYPFLAILAGVTAARLLSWRYAAVSLLSVIVFVGNTVSLLPHTLSYTNLIAGLIKEPYQLFDDSNIDWGQGLVTFNDVVMAKRPRMLLFSYFGRDNAAAYGFPSGLPWGSYKNDEICAFHRIDFPQYSGPAITAISVSNWHGCLYNQNPLYDVSHISGIAASSILLFPGPAL